MGWSRDRLALVGLFIFFHFAGLTRYHPTYLSYDLIYRVQFKNGAPYPGLGVVGTCIGALVTALSITSQCIASQAGAGYRKGGSPKCSLHTGDLCRERKKPKILFSNISSCKQVWQHPQPCAGAGRSWESLWGGTRWSPPSSKQPAAGTPTSEDLSAFFFFF